MGNLTILALAGGPPEAFPDEVVWAERLTVWPTDLADTVKRDVGDDAWGRYGGAASVALGGGGNLQKNTLHIAERLFNAFADGARPATLETLCEALLQFAGAEPAVADVESAAAGAHSSTSRNRSPAGSGAKSRELSSNRSDCRS